MLIRVTSGIRGFSEYLEEGHDKSRNDMDTRIPLYGDIQTFKSATDYLLKNKKYKHNYLHVTASFSIENNYLDNETLQSISREILEYYCAGYNLDEEVIAYAEAHKPKFQYMFNRLKDAYEQRLLHIHLGISRHHVPTDKQLWIAPFSLKADLSFQTYLNEKYGLNNPQRCKRKQSITKKDIIARVDGQYPAKQTMISRVRKELSELLEGVSNLNEAIFVLKQVDFIDDVFFKDMSNKKSGNRYLQVKLNIEGVKNINLRGNGFENLAQFYYSDEELECRSEQQKINLANESLESTLEVINRRREWATQQVEKRFRRSNRIDYEDVERRLLLDEPQVESQAISFKEIKIFAADPITEMVKEIDNQQVCERLGLERINEIKNNLPAMWVLEYAINRYGVLGEYHQLDGNKIKDTRSRAKPRNVVDFLTKNCNLRLSEALPILDEMYSEWLKQKSNKVKKVKEPSIAVVADREDEYLSYRQQLLDRVYRQDQYNLLTYHLANLVKYVDIGTPEQIRVTTKRGGEVIDRGDRLTALKGQDDEIKVMVAMAVLKGWLSVQISGSDDFKKMAYLALEEAGIGVLNYKPPKSPQLGINSDFHP